MQWKLLPRGAAPRAQGDDGGGKTMYCELCEEVKNVDDFSASGINSTAAAAESYVPDGFDVALNVAIARDSESDNENDNENDN